MVLTDNNAYRFEMINGKDTLLFSWKLGAEVDVVLFQTAIREFAQLCLEHCPARGVIDAQQLDQAGSAFAWLRGAVKSQYESYDTWWAREILPVYIQAGMGKLAVATGDPNAPGEVPFPDSGGAFRMGYFHRVDDAYAW